MSHVHQTGKAVQAWLAMRWASQGPQQWSVVPMPRSWCQTQLESMFGQAVLRVDCSDYIVVLLFLKSVPLAASREHRHHWPRWPRQDHSVSCNFSGLRPVPAQVTPWQAMSACKVLVTWREEWRMRGFGLARLDMLVLAGSARPVTPRRSPMRPTLQLLIEERRTAQTHTHTFTSFTLPWSCSRIRKKHNFISRYVNIYCILYTVLYTVYYTI